MDVSTLKAAVASWVLLEAAGMTLSVTMLKNFCMPATMTAWVELLPVGTKVHNDLKVVSRLTGSIWTALAFRAVSPAASKKGHKQHRVGYGRRC